VKNPYFPPFSLMRASVYLIIQLGQSSNLMLPKIYADKTMVKITQNYVSKSGSCEKHNTDFKLKKLFTVAAVG
jgi:hypothetical protein